MKRLRRITLAVVGATALGAVLFAALFVRGVFGVDDWTLRQIVALAQTYVVPTMRFGRFDFDLPARATLEDVRFTSPEGIEVLRVSRIELALAEMPRKGEPIRIRDVKLIQPRLLLARDAATGGFKGLLPFVKTDAVAEQRSLEPQRRLSEVFALRDLALIDGELVYDAGEGQPPMTLSGLSLTLDVEPTASRAEPGWYSFAFGSGAGPLARMQARGALSLDTLDLELDQLEARLDLTSDDAYAALPPALQQLLRAAQARGALQVEVEGAVPLRSPNDADARAHIELRDFYVAAAGYQIPLELGEIELALSKRQLRVEKALVRTLGGAAQLTQGLVDLRSPESALPAKAALQIDKLELEQFLASRAEASASPPRFAGLVSSEVELRADARRLPDSLQGKGWARIRQGRLLSLPVLSDLAQALEGALSVLQGGRVAQSELRRKDELDVAFALTPRGLRIDAFELVTPVALARGKGLVGYDGALDLRVSAGVVERLQKELGGIG
ncbi:MAG: hypothetical protein D6824_00030, partial [Planctomycetota bacterium]